MSTSIPTILSLVDENADISYLLDASEEESKEKEASKDAKTKIIELNNPNISLYGLELSNLLDFYLKNYSKPYLNLLSPPPEHNMV